MKIWFRRILMGICLHLLLTGFLLAGIRVCRSSYNHTHVSHRETASLRLTEHSAELTVLTRTFTVPLPENEKAVCLAGCVLMNGAVQFWDSLFAEFIKIS